jgi:pimeloyl-ACP methyl ester carboxylesterase
MMETPTLLLVHGSWHGPWCWEKLTPELDRLGIAWRAVQLPCVGTDATKLGTVADDAATIEAATREIPGDVVVVAHSYGGVPTTEARFGANVKHLVYLGAFMPDVGQGLINLLPPGPLPPFVIGRADGATEINLPLAVDTFYADCDAATAQWAIDHLRLHNGICNVTPVTRTSWREIPSTYIVLTEDHASPPFMQRELAKQATYVRELTTSHSPFLSRPKELAAMLAEIAAGAANGMRKAG